MQDREREIMQLAISQQGLGIFLSNALAKSKVFILRTKKERTEEKDKKTKRFKDKKAERERER